MVNQTTAYLPCPMWKKPAPAHYRSLHRSRAQLRARISRNTTGLNSLFLIKELHWKKLKNHTQKRDPSKQTTALTHKVLENNFFFPQEEACKPPLWIRPLLLCSCSSKRERQLLRLYSLKSIN